jgi:hypothetical protein
MKTDAANKKKKKLYIFEILHKSRKKPAAGCGHVHKLQAKMCIFTDT